MIVFSPNWRPHTETRSASGWPSCEVVIRRDAVAGVHHQPRRRPEVTGDGLPAPGLAARVRPGRSPWAGCRGRRTGFPIRRTDISERASTGSSRCRSPAEAATLGGLMSAIIAEGAEQFRAVRRRAVCDGRHQVGDQRVRTKNGSPRVNTFVCRSLAKPIAPIRAASRSLFFSVMVARAVRRHGILRSKGTRSGAALGVDVGRASANWSRCREPKLRDARVHDRSRIVVAVDGSTWANLVALAVERLRRGR